MQLQEFKPEDFEAFGDVRHEYPKFGREHDTSGEEICWCHPIIEHRVGGIVVVHSAEH